MDKIKITKVYIDNMQCIGCGACQSICEAVFTVEDVAEVNETNIPYNMGEIEEALECCPVDAINVDYDNEPIEQDKEIKEELEEEGKKDDEEKPNLEILMCHFPNALGYVAQAPNYGAKKYKEGVEEKNWSKVKNPIPRYRKAFLRHTFRWLSGEWIDKESGVPHICSMIWNLLVLIEFHISKEEKKYY